MEALRGATLEAYDSFAPELWGRGGQLEIKVTLKRASYVTEAVIQVHAGAPIDLLLGTDVQPRLGFMFLATDADGSAEELIQGGKWSCERSGNGPPSLDSAVPPLPTPAAESSSPPGTSVTVNLLQATHLPARFAKVVRAKVTTKSQSLSLFEPESELLASKSLKIPDAVVEPDCDQQITLVIENHGLSPLKLKKNHLLGHIRPADPVDMGEVTRAVEDADPVVATLQQSSTHTDRLLDTVNIGNDQLNEQEQGQLKELLVANAKVFALDETELGATGTITHTINTGSHPPIRQQPRRIHFALRDRVTQMVQDMLDNKIVQPSSSPWSSPIILVEKKDGSFRFCVDYRRLNAITKMDVFPLPRIDNTLDLLARSKFFTSLDLRSGYW